MSASQSGVYNLQAFTDLGALMVGGRLYTYAYGTTTQKTAYTDHAATTPHTYTSDGLGGQYIALNARGELPAPLYLAAGSYDLCLKNSDGSTEWTRRADPVFDITNDLAGTGGAALIGYTPAGSGAVATTVQTELRRQICIFDRMSAAQIADVVAGTASIDLTSVIQATEDYAASLSGGADIFWPAGLYRINSVINRKSYVNWVGAGKHATVIQYHGTATALNARGNETGAGANRIIIGHRDLTLKANLSANNSKGIALESNQRSMHMFDNVRIFGFGDHGVEFYGVNWIVYTHELEVSNCGINVVGSTGIYKDPNCSIFDVRFNGAVVEACGVATSLGGGIYMPAGVGIYSSGIWLNGCDIEGNVGADGYADTYIANANVFVEGGYFEPTQAGGRKTSVFNFDNCYATITNAQMLSSASVASYCIKANLATTLILDATNKFDTNYTSGQVFISGSSTCVAPNQNHFIVPFNTTNDRIIGQNGVSKSWGIFHGVAGVAIADSQNIASISRSGAGIYLVTMTRAMPAVYDVIVNAENGVPMFAITTIIDANSFNLYVYNSSAASADARKIAFQTISRDT